MKNFRSFLLSAVAFTFVIATPTQAASGNVLANKVNNTAVVSGVTDLNIAVNDLIQYIEQNADGSLFFDVNNAITEGASEKIIEQGHMFNDYVNSFAKYNPKLRGGLELYGNWCGPGHSGPDDPIDLLDTACMNHDKCYSWYGYFNCYCDDQLISEIEENYDDMGSDEQDMAVVVKTYFSLSPCVK